METQRKISKADLHIHTEISDGEGTPEDVVDMAVERGLNVIAVTDHNTLEGAERASAYAVRVNAPVEVLLGYEHKSSRGHLICLFPDTRFVIRPREMPRELGKAVAELKNNHGISIVPHPGYPVKSVGLDDDIYKSVDGVEVRSGFAQALKPTPFYVREEDVKRVTNHYDRAHIGSSDAHLVKYVGCTLTCFEGETAADLVSAIRGRRTTACAGNPHVPGFLDYLQTNVMNVRRYGPIGYVKMLRRF